MGKYINAMNNKDSTINYVQKKYPDQTKTMTLYYMKLW